MKLSRVIWALTGVVSLSISAQVQSEGSRYYNMERHYNSEISATEAYLEMMQNKSTLIDVRRLREYAAGHPERAYNVPFPHIIGRNDSDDPYALYWAVYDIVKGKMDAPITTLCRTGARSVLAGNILANPPGGLEPFTNVRNIWEGFVGQYKYAYEGGDVAYDHPELSDPPVPADWAPILDPLTGKVVHFPLDLNNSGGMDVDTADVYDHTTDANGDKDGWRNFQKLPWATKIRKPLAYLQDRKQYKDYQE